MTVRDVFKYIDEIAPFCTAESWDNCGLLIGNMNTETQNVMIVLDVTAEVIDEAVSKNVDLIISHHPVIFNGLKSIDENSVVYKVVKNNIAIICAHTNLDAAPEGVTKALADLLELKDLKILNVLGEINSAKFGEGLIGELNAPMTGQQLAQKVKSLLNCGFVKLNDSKKTIKYVAVANGAENGMLEFAKSVGADAVVAGETKHNVMIDAKNYGITLIDAGHFETENIIVKLLEEKLKSQFKELNVIHSVTNVCPYETV